MRPIDADALPYGPAVVGDEGGWTEKIIAIPKSAVDAAPTLDYAPVVHAKWKYYHKQNKAVCTACSFEWDLDDDLGRAIACPNCGARMN